MKIAFFSPLPPSKTGIADYSAALLDPLKKIAEVEVHTERPSKPPNCDIALYQLGNNPYHAFAYEQALAEPGVVVMHEANLHHLVVDLTIRRNDWDAYLEELRFDGGDAAFEYGRDYVQTRKKGPDYEGVPMIRRVLSRSRGAIVHSRCVEDQLRQAGFEKPIAVIPHGAWIPEVDVNGYRSRLGVEAGTPLIGIFGFLKPYKRIAESLRAFRRLVRLRPDVRMVLVGEVHPEFPVQSLIDSLGLGHSVRVLGFTPIEDFVGYIGACDIILNLRYPTVGESSGTLLRSLGLGKSVIVSDVGSFAEYPDEICLKVPVDATEEDCLFEYLNLLVSRPDLARELGARARAWVAQECSWDSVAERYAEFLSCVVSGRPHTTPVKVERPAAPEAEPPPVSVAVDESYLRSWTPADDPGARSYVDTHLARFQKTLDMTPPGGPESRVLEMGAYMQITPALKKKLGYGEVRGCYYGPLGKVEHKEVVSSDGDVFACDIDLFDAEKDRFPYPDECFDTVLCCELLEHLFSDPMHMMSEINRILKPGGHLVLTTPNITSLRALQAILQGYHPGFFPAYIKPANEGGETDARHNREYAPREIHSLFVDSGFDVIRLETGEFRDEPHPEHLWISHLLERYFLSTDLRGDDIYAVGRKAGPVRERYPGWLYAGES